MVLWSKFAVYMKFYYGSSLAKTGTLSYDELLMALMDAGIQVDENIIKMQFTILKADPFISLVDWIMFMIRMDSMAATFQVTEMVVTETVQMSEPVMYQVTETMTTDGTGMVTKSWSEWSTVTSVSSDQI